MNKHDHSNLSSGNLTATSGLTLSSVWPFAAYALPLFRAGYLPIPLIPGEKRPALGKGWEKHRRKTIADQRRDMMPEKGDEFLVGEGEIALWITQYPNAGLGVLCGDLVGVDVDNEAVAQLVHSIIPGTLVAKRGRRGYTLLYGNGGGVVNENFRGRDGMLVEILAGGRQTVLPPTIHPDTGQPYYNLDGFAPLHDVPIGSLPLLTVAHVDALRSALITHGFMEAPKPPKVGEPEDLEHLNANRDRYAGFARRKLDMQAALLAHPREHGRRQGANNTAFALGPYVAHGLISEEEIWQSIDWASQENGKYTELDGNGRRAVRQAFEKGLSDGMKNPLPKLTDEHPHAQRQAAKAGALPPPPAEYVPRVHMNADGSVETRWGPPDGSDGATAPALWMQPQAGSLTPAGAYVHRQLQSEMEYEASTAYEPMLIKRLLPASPGLVAFIAGQSGAGKTFYAVGLAVALASGTPFLDFPCRESVGVVIVAAEGAGTIKRRIDAAKAMVPGLGGQKLPIVIIKKCPDLMTQEGRDELVAEVRRRSAQMIADGLCTRVGAVIIDSMTVAFSMEDEQGNTEATRVCLFMRAIGEATGTVVVPVHHFGKDKSAGLRGASAWRAASDHTIAVLGDRDETTGEVTNKKLALTRSRSDEEGVICCFDLPIFSCGVDPYGDEITTCTFARTVEDPMARVMELEEKKRSVKKDGGSGAIFAQAYDALLQNVAGAASVDGHECSSLRELKSPDGTVTLVGVNRIVMGIMFKKFWPSDENAARQQWNREIAKMRKRREYCHFDGFIYRGWPSWLMPADMDDEINGA